LDRCNDPQEAERIMRVTSEFIQVIPWTHVESYVRLSEELARFATVAVPISTAAAAGGAGAMSEAEVRTRSVEYFREGLSHYFERDDKEAIKAFNQAQRLMPQEARIYGAMGLVYLRHDRLDVAAKCFEAARQCGGDPTALYRLIEARTHFCGGEITEAIRLLQEVTREQPDNHDAAFHFVCCHAASQANVYRSAANFATSLSADDMLGILRDLVEKDRKFFLKIKFSRDLAPVRPLVEEMLSGLHRKAREEAVEKIAFARAHQNELTRNDLAGVRAKKALALAEEALDSGSYFGFLDVIERVAELEALLPKKRKRKGRKGKAQGEDGVEKPPARITPSLDAATLLGEVEEVVAEIRRKGPTIGGEDLLRIADRLETLASSLLSLPEVTAQRKASNARWGWTGFVLGLLISGLLMGGGILFMLKM
ncbi:MAG: hypothetical protein D6812_15850, partial [Deltaproteobacteria bacterium]